MREANGETLICLFHKFHEHLIKVQKRRCKKGMPMLSDIDIAVCRIHQNGVAVTTPVVKTGILAYFRIHKAFRSAAMRLLKQEFWIVYDSFCKLISEEKRTWRAFSFSFTPFSHHRFSALN